MLLSRKMIVKPNRRHNNIINSRVVTFKMEMTGVFSDTLSRQVMEGVQINSFQRLVMNKKSAWRQPVVSRPQFVMDVEKDYLPPSPPSSLYTTWTARPQHQPLTISFFPASTKPNIGNVWTTTICNY